MADYRVADGHNNAVGLADVSPQPASPDGIQFAQLRDAADGSSEGLGFPFIVLTWSVMSRAEKNSILAAFGLSDTITSNDVTVQIPSNAHEPDDPDLLTRNATAKHTPGGRGFVFPRNLEIRLVHIHNTV